MDLERGDIVFIAIILGLGASVAYGFTLNGTDEAGTQGAYPELAEECRKDARAVEVNSTLMQRWGTAEGCECIPPSEVDTTQYRAPRTVEERTVVYVVSCQLADGAPMESPAEFPVRRIVNGSADVTANTSLPTNGSASVIR